MTIRTQLALLALVAAVIMPAIAMDKKFNIGEFKGAGVAGVAITNALKDLELKKEVEAKEQATREAEQAEALKKQEAEEQAKLKAQEAALGVKLAEEKVKAEAEAARIKKALDEQATTVKLDFKKRPKGQSGRKNPEGNRIVGTPVDEFQLNVKEEKTEQVEPKAPAKGGQTHGINLGTLGAIKLKKSMGAKRTPLKPLSKATTEPQVAALPAEAKRILDQYQLLDAANKKLELVYALKAYAENQSPVTKQLIMEYVKISKQLEATPELADALTKFFEAKDAASYKVALENIKTNILKVV